tara:strand:+ start:415 stop:1308 length:894 start_codon:yes stop_codon:yes gene_type:complete
LEHLINNNKQKEKSEMNNTFLNSRGHHDVNRNDLRKVRIPEATKSYSPIGHVKLINTVEKVVLGELPNFELLKEDHRVSCNGDLLNTKLTLAPKGIDIDVMPKDMLMGGITIVNSYNKWTPVTIGAGANVLVCTNGMTAWDGVIFARKHTPNMMEDIITYAKMASKLMVARLEQFENDKINLMNTELSDDDGNGIIGKLIGREVLTPTAANIAFKDWKNARHSVFSKKNMWSLYNCANEGLKKVDNYSSLSAHCSLHHYMTNGFDKDGMLEKVKAEVTGMKSNGYKDYESKDAIAIA